MAMLRHLTNHLPSLSARTLSTTTAVSQNLLNTAATEVSELSNGLRIASEAGHGEMASVGVWVDAGSRSETSENNGVAHFLEHMAFKGTSNRTKTELEMEIENMGGHLNAYTSREQTVYYATVFKNDVPNALEILSDILQNANYEESAVEREKSVILRESDEVDSMPEEVVFDRLHETAYQGHSLSQTILGPKENIMKINRDQLKNYVSSNYVGSRMVVAAAGAVDHDEVCKVSEKLFSSLPKGSSAAAEGKPEFIGSDIRLRDDSMPLAHVALSFEGPGATSEHAVTMQVIQTLLGTWSRTSGVGANMSSKLCNHVATNNLAHSVSSFNTMYKDTGLFGVYAVADAEKVNDLTWSILESMVGLCHKVSPVEVDLAKAQLKAAVVSQLDGSANVCEEIGRHMLTYGRRISIPEMFARIDAVGVEDVKAAGNAFINDHDVAVAALGQIHELPDYNFLRRHTYWLRT